ncbi:MAG: IPT/TIG domain-containing protein [Acidobacteriota bacterium]|nr:IPT/TIG domain-containing protein [Acidobacteriota bacterium]
MAFRKSSDPRPQILEVSPAAAIPGGEFQVRGKNFAGSAHASVTIGAAPAPLVVGSDSFLIVRVPDNAVGGQMVVSHNGDISTPRPLQVGVQIAEGLHPVANPAVDSHGNIYATFSGSRGQKTPVSIFQVETSTGQTVPFVSELMNASGLAIDADDVLYASSRQEGNIYRVSAAGNSAVYVEGMGVATGIVFDPEGNLYVGDRSGTIFKVSRQRQIYVFATLESSISAYHLAFGPDHYLYVTGPTTSSFDCVHRISPAGEVEVFYRGLGRPQGMAFDAEDNLYVAASLQGRRGIVRITPAKQAELFLSGPGIVGLAFAPGRDLVLATSGALYRVHVDIDGRRPA